MTNIDIEYDCGYKISFPTRMPEGSSMLHHASLVDTLSGYADASHDEECQVCT